MQQIDRVTVLAQQAAQLLPEPPGDRDLDGYLEWTELVWTTAMRISAIAGACLDGGADGHDVDFASPVTGSDLVAMARIARHEWQGATPVARSAEQVSGDGPVLAPPVVLAAAATSSATGGCAWSRQVALGRTQGRIRPSGRRSIR